MSQSVAGDLIRQLIELAKALGVPPDALGKLAATYIKTMVVGWGMLPDGMKKEVQAVIQAKLGEAWDAWTEDSEPPPTPVPVSG